MHPFNVNKIHFQQVDTTTQIHSKADQSEIHTLSRRLDSLEHTNREACSEIASLRHRCERLEASCQELIERWQQDNSQFGVGA